MVKKHLVSSMVNNNDKCQVSCVYGRPDELNIAATNLHIKGWKAEPT